MPSPHFYGPDFRGPDVTPGLTDRPQMAAAEPPSDQRRAETAEEPGISFVYVPTHPYEPVTTEPREVAFEIRRLGDGSAGLAIFTEEAKLVATLGEHQPFVRIAVLDLLLRLANEKIPIVVNPTLQDGVQKRGPVGGGERSGGTG